MGAGRGPRRSARARRRRRRVGLGAGELAALYTGWATTAVLARTGLVEGGTAAERTAPNRVFAGPAPWMLDEF